MLWILLDMLFLLYFVLCDEYCDRFDEGDCRVFISSESTSKKTCESFLGFGFWPVSYFLILLFNLLHQRCSTGRKSRNREVGLPILLEPKYCLNSNCGYSSRMADW
eukprot:UN04604